MKANVRRLAIGYPVALDNDYATWNAWHNQYWPAKYLIDADGHLRYYHFGEGEYGKTEAAIRSLLRERVKSLPAETRLADPTPTESTTSESYLGYERLERYGGSPVRANVDADYRFPAHLGLSELAYAGGWRVEQQRIVARSDARLRLRYQARNVFLVLGGLGNVRVLLDGKPHGIVHVDGDRLYTVVRSPAAGEHLLELQVDPGLEAYAFTFG